MAETVKGMKDAVMGQGGGLQETSTRVGDAIADNTDTRGSQSKKSDEASESLGQFGKDPGTTPGTSIKSADQVSNMKTGTADHLNLGGKE